MKTLIELQEILGKETELLSNRSNVLKPSDLERSKAISSLAKQMINNADIVLRADKICSTKRIDKLIGE
ncbi:MAG: hypothetical protein J6V44_16345 [Methanobrevibacter sp.]|nr:hypothetical protein [Methanobrevibacter sp.]MBO7692029.1 hypothetical protein [Methanobrevibacter sp.]